MQNTTTPSKPKISSVQKERREQASSFLTQVINPTLKQLHLPIPTGPNSIIQAAQLLLGTAIQESAVVYREQIGGGPGRGLYQMEPDTFDDIHDNFLKFRPSLLARVNSFSPTKKPSFSSITEDDVYATVIARIHYFRVPEPLPAMDDIGAQAWYWKKHFNSMSGKGKVSQYISNWNYYVGESDAV